MRRLAALLALAPLAAASPATPPPLEQLVAEARLIVVGDLASRPQHVGDVYEVEVAQTLKGNAPAGALRVRAPDYFRGCIVRADEPPAPAREAEVERGLLFLGSPDDGAHDVLRVVGLVPDEGMTAWFGGGHSARHGPGAVRALVALHAAGPQRAAALWIEGLAGDNPLLAEALLHRYAAVLGGDDWDFGEGNARRDAEAAGDRLLPAALALCTSPVPPVREQALDCALRAWPAAPPAPDSLFGEAVAAARESARSDDRWVREASLRLLVRAADAEAAPALVAALARPDDVDIFALATPIALAPDLVAARPQDRETVTGALIPLLDRREDTGRRARDALRAITGEDLDGPAAWRDWWAAR